MGQRVTCMGALHPHKYPQDATTLDFVPSQRNKRRNFDRLSSSVARSLERLPIYVQFYRFTHTPPQTSLPIYRPQICKFSRKLKESSWLMLDTAFRYMAASNVSMAQGKVNEQLYNDILRLSPTATASIATPMTVEVTTPRWLLVGDPRGVMEGWGQWKGSHRCWRRQWRRKLWRDQKAEEAIVRWQDLLLPKLTI